MSSDPTLCSAAVLGMSGSGYIDDISLPSLNETSGAKTFEMPFDIRGVPIVNKFVERDREMSAIKNSLRPGVANTQRRILVLHGLGGTGKTQLSLAYARKHRDDHTAIVWLNGQTQDSLKQSIAGVARSLPTNQLPGYVRNNLQQGSGELEEVIDEVLEWFGNPGNTQWLLIYDNVDRDASDQVQDPEAYDIRKFFPNSDHGSIIITTRRLQLRHLGDELKVNTMTTEEGTELLRNTLGNFRDGKDILLDQHRYQTTRNIPVVFEDFLIVSVMWLQSRGSLSAAKPVSVHCPSCQFPWWMEDSSTLLSFGRICCHSNCITHSTYFGEVDGSNGMLTCHRHFLCDNTS